MKGNPVTWPAGLYERLTGLGKAATGTAMFIECAKECARITVRAHGVYHFSRYWDALDDAQDSLDRVEAAVNPRDAAARLGYVVAYVLDAMRYYTHLVTTTDKRFSLVKTFDEAVTWIGNALDELERGLVSGVYNHSVNVQTTRITQA